jgi:prolyl-tRNA editing enzyme YbaK/EbsC (Cys-tRNA(Pro) deacylase)
VNDTTHHGNRELVEAAARKGVTLDIRLMPTATHTAEEAAAAVGVGLGQIVRPLVYVAPPRLGRPVTVVCLVSGRNDVDLGYLAAVTGEVNLRRATDRETLELTGYPAGDVPPFGYGRNVPTVMDQDLTRYEWVWAAAGTDGALVRVTPQTLRALCNAMVAPVAATSWRHTQTLSQSEPGLQFGGSAGA